MPDLDPRHLRYLIAVAETGSITRAARRLMMTQPALSRALQALERTVGVPLLVRRHQATGLTEAGSVLLADAYELVERSRAAIERARGAYTGAETLTVSVPVCDVLAVAAAGRDFEAGHPGVRVHVVPRGWPERPEELGATAADVTILRDCFDRGDLIVDPLVREPRAVLLPAGHPLAARESLTVADLRDEPFTYWDGMSAAEADHWTGADADPHPRRPGPRVRDTTEVLAAVVLGRAIVFAHGTTLPADELPGLRVRPVEGLTPSILEIGVPAGARNPLAERFVAHARTGWVHTGS